MADKSDRFYLGRGYDPEKEEITGEALHYDPEDLTTHAVALGMTGSGKTGLCIDLLEEAALQGIPALMIDPKGDMTNTLLHFPALRPEDFTPWVDPDQARREGKSLQEAGEEAASLWKSGLEKWDITPARIQSLQDAAHFAVYTPGSEAGIPVNILASLAAPDLGWEEHRETLLEKISGIAMSLLGLVGVEDLDPVQSREHILVSNIFEHSWSRGEDLDLSELILQIQNPPFEKLGVLDVESFFPEKERNELALLLNNILAAPSFQSWIQGQPLEIPSLLFGEDDRPRHSVFYIAHLSDAERMFFVTLLYSAVETWMRTQKGSSSLRALLYFDEIYGYLPPVKNPPSKTPMLRMLKQARAFGVGQVLVTQNPVDVDYKALSNAGTWFIGKLQTEQDKNRLLDGLEGAAPGMDRKTYDKLISQLDKRVFLLHNVHEKEPVLFHTRWAMNYLTGPLTRAQIPALNALVGADQLAAGAPAEGSRKAGKKEPTPSQEGSATRPNVPTRIDEYFLPVVHSPKEAAAKRDVTLTGEENFQVAYRPALLAQARVRFQKRNYNLDHDLTVTSLVYEPGRQGRVDWEEWKRELVDPKELDRKPEPDARFFELAAPFSDGSALRDLETDFKDWIYHEVTVAVRANEELDVFAGPQISQGEFRKLCAEKAREEIEEEKEKVEESYDRKLDTIQDRLVREERELEEDQAEFSQRRLEEMGTHAENLLSLLAGRRRRMTTSLTKRRMTSKAKADIQESLEVIDQYKQEIEDLQKEQDQELAEVEVKWQEILEEISEIEVSPYKKDILVELFGVAWVPVYLGEGGGRTQELSAF